MTDLYYLVGVDIHTGRRDTGGPVQFDPTRSTEYVARMARALRADHTTDGVRVWPVRADRVDGPGAAWDRLVKEVPALGDLPDPDALTNTTTTERTDR